MRLLLRFTLRCVTLSVACAVLFWSYEAVPQSCGNNCDWQPCVMSSDFCALVASTRGLYFRFGPVGLPCCNPTSSGAYQLPWRPRKTCTMTARPTVQVLRRP